MPATTKLKGCFSYNRSPLFICAAVYFIKCCIEMTTCWVFFFPPVGEADCVFAGHTHEVELIRDCPPGGITVPCAECLVNNDMWVLTYDPAVEPPDESGITQTPL